MAPEGLGNRDQEGLVQMAMGLHGSGQGQGEAGFPDPDQGFNPGNGCPVDGDGQIDEAVPIGGQATATARGQRTCSVWGGARVSWRGWKSIVPLVHGMANPGSGSGQDRRGISMKWHKTVKNLHGITPWCIHLTFC